MLQLHTVQALLKQLQQVTDHLHHTHTSLLIMEGHTLMLVLVVAATTMVEDTIPQLLSEVPWEL